MARKRDFTKHPNSGPTPAEASVNQRRASELKADGAKRGGRPTLNATKHEGVTGSPTETKSEEDFSYSEEYSCSDGTAPPVKAPPTTSTKGGALPLGNITKPPVKIPSVPNPYATTRVGISKFVVPKESILHRPPTQRVWARTTPTLRTPLVTAKDKGAASLVINGG